MKWEEPGVSVPNHSSSVNSTTAYGKPLIIGVTCEGKGPAKVELDSSDTGKGLLVEAFEVPACPAAATYVIPRWTSKTIHPRFEATDDGATKITVSVGRVRSVADAQAITQETAGVTSIERATQDYPSLASGSLGAVDLWVKNGKATVSKQLTLDNAKAVSIAWACDGPYDFEVRFTAGTTSVAYSFEGCDEGIQRDQLDLGELAVDASGLSTVTVTRKTGVGAVHVGVTPVKG